MLVRVGKSPGTAHKSWKGSLIHIQKEEVARARMPTAVRFQEDGGRGLLVRAWVNDAGPYTFAIDTGAGATILSSRVASEARVSLSGKRPIRIGGLSPAGGAVAQEVVVRKFALGDQSNVLPSSGLVIVTQQLAPGVDGVLDPAEVYWPLGFEIDLPRGLMSAFDARLNPLRRNQSLPADGTIVPWLFDGQSRRPFVMLEGGRKALLDTGSGFGLAVTEEAARALGIASGRGRESQGVRDISGGGIPSRRVSPATVHLGALVLQGIPTDILQGARAGSPILLGRDALRPFRLTFDPINRLIRIMAG
jgi:predicted aspartyl protease